MSSSDGVPPGFSVAFRGTSFDGELSPEDLFNMFFGGGGGLGGGGPFGGGPGELGTSISPVIY